MFTNFLFSKKLFNEHKKIRLVGEQNNEPFEKPLHDIFKKEICLSPVSSVAYHISRASAGIESDWLELWNKNYQEIDGGPRIDPSSRMKTTCPNR